MSAPPRPRLRLIHNLARSGGTLLAKCVGSMAGVALLSEIHPRGARYFNALDQAHRWHRLLRDEDVARLARGPGIGFVEAIELIERRCAERGATLVLRDWAHLDFIGVPFTQSPGHRLALADLLGERFALRRVCLVRDPHAQWKSLRRLPIMQGVVDAGMFASGYAAYAAAAEAVGYLRYEDLTREPGRWMRHLCTVLDLDFDPGFETGWATYAHVTGAVDAGGPGRRAITPAPPTVPDPDLARAIAARPELAAIIARLGYQH